MEFTTEMLEKAKTAKSEEELLEMAKAENIEMTAEEAAKYFADLHKSGELSDEELNNVAGGCGYQSGDEPLYADGQIVYVKATNAPALILENLGKYGGVFKYKIEVRDTGLFTLERWESELKKSYSGD